MRLLRPDESGLAKTGVEGCPSRGNGNPVIILCFISFNSTNHSYLLIVLGFYPGKDNTRGLSPRPLSSRGIVPVPVTHQCKNPGTIKLMYSISLHKSQTDPDFPEL